MQGAEDLLQQYRGFAAGLPRHIANQELNKERIDCFDNVLVVLLANSDHPVKANALEYVHNLHGFGKNSLQASFQPLIETQAPQGRRIITSVSPRGCKSMLKLAPVTLLLSG